jgi:hypothetical protein
MDAGIGVDLGNGDGTVCDSLVCCTGSTAALFLGIIGPFENQTTTATQAIASAVANAARLRN